MLKNIRHIGIVVENPEFSFKFWTKILGMTLISDQIESGPIIDSVLGLKNVKVRTIKLAAQQNGIIELLHFENPSLIAGQVIAPNTKGITHIALEVNNLEEHRFLLEQNGVQFFDSIKLSVDGRVKVMYARGPENIILEFVEIIK